MKSYFGLLQEMQLAAAAKKTVLTGFIEGQRFVIQGGNWSFKILSLSSDMSNQPNAIRDTLMAWGQVQDKMGNRWQLNLRKNGSFRLWGRNGSVTSPGIEGKFLKHTIRSFMEEGWSAEYKRSINCNRPKGFSQKAHCQGRKKK
jgi:hypothetical protein